MVVAGLSTADALRRESQRRFRPLGLSGAQSTDLNLPAEATAGVSQRERSDRLGVDRSTVTGLLDRMGKAGWVRREDPPEDRRCYLVVLTPAGRAMWGQATTLDLDGSGWAGDRGAGRETDGRVPRHAGDLRTERHREGTGPVEEVTP